MRWRDVGWPTRRRVRSSEIAECGRAHSSLAGGERPLALRRASGLPVSATPAGPVSRPDDPESGPAEREKVVPRSERQPLDAIAALRNPVSPKALRPDPRGSCAAAGCRESACLGNQTRPNSKPAAGHDSPTSILCLQCLSRVSFTSLGRRRPRGSRLEIRSARGSIVCHMGLNDYREILDQAENRVASIRVSL